MVIKVYVYRVIKEDFNTGERAKRAKLYRTDKPLNVGGLYVHLGKGYNGCQRVLELVDVEECLI